MTVKNLFLVQRLSAAVLAVLVLGSCSLDNEFDLAPYKNLSQTSRSLSDILGYPVPQRLDSRQLSMKAFHLEDRAYLALQVMVDGRQPELVILDDQLGDYRRLKKTPTMDWSPAQWWHIDGSRNRIYFGTPYISVAGYRTFVPPISAYAYFLDQGGTNDFLWNTPGASAPFLAFRGPDRFVTIEKVVAQSYATNLTSATNLTPSSVPALNIAGLYHYGPSGPYDPGSTNPAMVELHTFLMDFEVKGSPAVAWVIHPGPYPEAPARPVYFLNRTAAAQTSSSMTTTGLEGQRIMDLAFDPARDDKVWPLGDFILDIRASDEGFLVPYPSGRDRLVDYETGTVRYIYQVVQTGGDNHDTLVSPPRAYLNGAEYWFVYDQSTRSIIKARGWWL